MENEKYNGGTLFCQLVEVSGFNGAIIGKKKKKNSWRLQDSKYENGKFILGENDKKLAQTLIKAGNEHRKFLRMIHVQFNINMPRYLFSELDTYKISTVSNSCSTQHKLLNADDEKDWVETELDRLLSTRGELSKENFWYHKDVESLINQNILALNRIRYEYLNTNSSKKKQELRRMAKQILPECYLQCRMLDMNYETLRNIYQQRKHHQLDIEWGVLLDFIESLPYAEELLLYGIDKRKDVSNK